MRVTLTPIQQIEKWFALGLSYQDLAYALGIDPRTIRRWCSDEGPIPQRDSRRNLNALDALHDHLLGSFDTPQDASIWLNAGSRYLGGLKPIDLLRARRIDRVEAALSALDLGVFV